MRRLVSILFFIAAAVPAHALTKIRVGWQVPWAVQGQIVQIWKHTDILKKNGLEAEFIGKTYGPELNEIALAGAIDVSLNADQPSAALFAKDKGWIGIARLMYNRTSTYVPPKSNISKLEDLKGKTIGLPIGAAAERIIKAALKSHGVDPKTDVTFINLGIQEQGPLVQSQSGKSKWRQFDALSGFDPLPAILEAKGLVKTLDVGKVCSMVLMSEGFIAKNPTVAEKVAQALVDAYDYYRTHAKQANAWFMREAQLKGADQKTCDIAASIEPNLKAQSRSEMRISFNDDDFKTLQEAADFLEPQIKKHLDMHKFVTNKYLAGVK